MEGKFLSLSELLKDGETAQKLLGCSPEEAVLILREQYHLEFTVDELKDVATGIQDALKDASDELSADQLESVAGGGKGSGAYNAGYYIGKTVKVIGVAATIGKVAIAVGLISW